MMFAKFFLLRVISFHRSSSSREPGLGETPAIADPTETPPLPKDKSAEEDTAHRSSEGVNLKKIPIKVAMGCVKSRCAFVIRRWVSMYALSKKNEWLDFRIYRKQGV